MLLNGVRPGQPGVLAELGHGGNQLLDLLGLQHFAVAEFEITDTLLIGKPAAQRRTFLAVAQVQGKIIAALFEPDIQARDILAKIHRRIGIVRGPVVAQGIPTVAQIELHLIRTAAEQQCIIPLTAD